MVVSRFSSSAPLCSSSRDRRSDAPFRRGLGSKPGHLAKDHMKYQLHNIFITPRNIRGRITQSNHCIWEGNILGRNVFPKCKRCTKHKIGNTCLIRSTLHQISWLVYVTPDLLGPVFQKKSSGISDHGLNKILEMGFSKLKRNYELKSDHVIRF